MKRSWKVVALVAGGLAACAATLYGLGTWSLGTALAQRLDLPAVDLPVTADAGQIALGEHLTRTRGCMDCHGETLTGKHVVDAGPVMQIHAPNLTPGGVRLDPVQFEHAVRHGIGREGQMLMLMPASDYSLMSNEDLAAIHAYLQSLPADATVQPVSQIGPLGRVLFLFGQLPIFEAPRIDHARASRGDAAPIGDPVAFGAYIAQTCRGCHGAELAGGPMPGQPPGVPDPANLTPHPTGLASWSEADFLKAMREGERPDGSAIHEFMPWKTMGRMRGDELHALWTYLHGLPARPKGA